MIKFYIYVYILIIKWDTLSLRTVWVSALCSVTVLSTVTVLRTVTLCSDPILFIINHLLLSIHFELPKRIYDQSSRRT